MSLENGTYIITNKATRRPVGALEGSSDPLTRVVTLPGGVKAPFWKLTKEGEDSYKLSQEQGAALEINNLLFLDLKTHYPHPATWKIERVSHEGDDAGYIITSSNEGGVPLGWVVTNPTPFSQVSVRHLIATPSFPPQYPPSEVFSIVRVDRDDAN
ncbi:hypothetical protein MD484_g8758, partial [Candolleomyces efflorescens]